MRFWIILLCIILMSCSNSPKPKVPTPIIVKSTQPLVLVKPPQKIKKLPPKRELQKLERYTPVIWRELTKESVNQAIKENKLLFIYTRSASSPGCLFYERETFRDSGLSYILNHEYIPIMIDLDKNTDINSNPAVPIIIIMTSTGDVILSTTKLLNSNQLAEVLDGLAIFW